MRNPNSEKKHSQSFSWDGPRNSIDGANINITTNTQNTPSKQLPNAPDSYRNSNKENYLNTLQLTPSTKARSEASSAGNLFKSRYNKIAIAGAMKALQDKLKITESEMTEMKKAVDHHEKIKQEALETQKKRFEHELALGRDRENQLQRNIDKLHDENRALREDMSRLQGNLIKHEEEIAGYRQTISKLRDEINQGHQDRILLQKEIDLVESEKNTHLEKNVEDRDQFEKKMDELIAQLEGEREKVRRLEAEKKELIVIKAESDAQLDKVSSNFVI